MKGLRKDQDLSKPKLRYTLDYHGKLVVISDWDKIDKTDCSYIKRSDRIHRILKQSTEVIA